MNRWDDFRIPTELVARARSLWVAAEHEPDPAGQYQDHASFIEKLASNVDGDLALLPPTPDIEVVEEGLRLCLVRTVAALSHRHLHENLLLDGRVPDELLEIVTTRLTLPLNQQGKQLATDILASLAEWIFAVCDGSLHAPWGVLNAPNRHSLATDGTSSRRPTLSTQPRLVHTSNNAFRPVPDTSAIAETIVGERASPSYVFKRAK